MKGLCTSLADAKATSAGMGNYGKVKNPRRRRERLMKTMEKIVKRLIKARSREEDGKEKAENGQEIKLTEQHLQENEEAIVRAREEKGNEDMAAKKAEKERAAKGYMEELDKLFEEIKESIRGKTSKSSREKSSARENRVDPFWWMGLKGKQEDRVEVATQSKSTNKESRHDSPMNIREKDDERDRIKRKRVKGRKQQKRRINVSSGERKPLPKIRKIESPTHIIIKERMSYVKGKGWKVNILKIKKSRKLSRKRTKVKKYTILCDKNQSKCRISKAQTRNKLSMLRRKEAPGRTSKRLRRMKTKQNLKNL